MTIHHSGGREKQEETGNLGEKSGRGERLAMAMFGRAIRVLQPRRGHVLIGL
jgi:hypothetical protein